MQIIHTISELRQIVSNYKQAGQVIGLVPTMGNLHQGHLQLVEMAHSKTDIVICSIFVNPMQFGEGEDFGQYPRTLDSDIDKLKQVACDIVYVPAVDEMYPESQLDGRDQTQVIVPGVSDVLDGVSRPGHFTGVATIVSKLFNMVQPDKAIFGEKDYQQLQIIRQFVRDLCFPVEIIAHPIVREASGLAMSSRNGYLSNVQKQQAAFLYRTLQILSDQIINGLRDYSMLEKQTELQINKQGFICDYVKICSSDLSPAGEKNHNLVILLAAYLGKTRLIDNIQITL
ncbi:MAG: pantoate--beta-alanine ligase [gamma proteobacterium symbiont of Taylorina sp.]|nr:pantoate--beta-alanine ligase [gamma proteobacterium symbiont of Taylorina sp.]